jgi:SAM-dependent methyltransferase
MTWMARLYVWATHRLYSELAWAYDWVSWLVSFGHWADMRRMALDDVTGRRVLEVGFGTGELLLEMAHRELEVVGLELSPAMHRIAARKLRRRCLEVPRLRGRIQAAPLASGRFDSIVCTFPAGYILEPETLQEAARLLRAPDTTIGSAGGRFIVVGMVVGRKSRWWRWAMRFVFGGGAEGSSDPANETSLGRFERLAVAAGFRVTVVEGMNGGWHVPVMVAERVIGSGGLQ